MRLMAATNCRTRQIQEGLPELKLKKPWYGYNLGFWTDENEEQAALAVKGEYYETGEVFWRRRKRLD